MVPPLPRVPEAPGLVEGGAYFVVHAPRRSGKTTFLRAFAKQLTAEGLFTALYTTCEIAEAHGDDFVGAQSALVQRLIVDDDVFDDDVSYVVDLGLVKSHPLRIANPIYTEVIARVLSSSAQQNVLADPRSFVRPDGRFDLDVLLREFAAFWIENGDVLANGVTYREAGAQLVLMAFLQRVVNGGGTVTREYGIGSRRIDLLVTWPFKDEAGKSQVQREAIELKVWRDGRKDPLTEGLTQLDRYLDRVGLDSGVLVLFDRRSQAVPIEERTREERAVTPKGRPVRVLRA